MVAFQLDIVEILFHGPHMIACCALGDVRQPLQHRVVDPRMLAIDLLFLLWSMGSDSNLPIVFYVQIMPDDLVMQLHRF